MAVEYKFKPYTPQNLKIASPQSSLSQQEKTRKSLEAQRANLDQRLRAEGIDPETLGGEFDNRNLFEKALNLTPDQGLLLDFFEIIDRPVEAVKNAAMSGMQGESLLKGFWEGISGQKEVSGVELVKEATGFEPETEVGKFLLNIGSDILFDPLTYLPPGIIGKALKTIGGVGSKAVTTEVAQQVARSAARQTADDFGRRILDSAQAIVDDVARADVTDLDTAIKEVLVNGGEATSNVRNVYLIEDALDTMSVQDIAKGIQDGTLSETILTASGQGKKLLQERLIRMSDIVNGNYVPTGPGEAAEIRRYLKIYERIEGLDPDNIIVVLNKSPDRFDDIGIFYKTKIGNKVSLVKVDSIEIKQMTQAADAAKKGGEAFFSNIVMNSGIDAATGLKTIAFGKATSLSAKMQDAIITTFRKINTGFKINGREVFLDELIGLASDALKNGDKALVKKYNKIIRKTLRKGDNATKQLLRKMYADIAGESKIGFTFLETGLNGDGVLIDVSKNIEKFTENFDIMTSTSGRTGKQQLRFKTGFSIADDIDVSQFADEGDTLLSRFTQAEGSEQVTEIWTLARRAREGEFGEIARKISKAMKKIEMNIRITFNLTAGLSPETADLIRSAYGQNLFELERRSAKLTEIKRRLIQVDPDAGEILGEIIEANAKVVNGRIVKMRRRMGTSDFLDYILVRTQDAVDILLPKFPDEAARQSFLQTINKMWRDYSSSTDDFFEVVEQGAGTALKFDGGPEDIKEFIKWFNEQQAAAAQGFARNIPDYMEFGEKALSPKTRKFLMDNANDVEEYRSMSEEILQELVDVAGFDNLPRELANQIGYMRHTMTMEAYKAMQRQMPEVASIFARPGTNTLKQRTFIGSVQEVNAGMREFMGLKMDLFDPNAFNAMEDLIKIAHRKLDQARVLDIILTNKGVDMKNLMRVVDNTQDYAKTLTPYDKMFKGFKDEFNALYENLSPAARETLDKYLIAQGYKPGKAIVMNKSAFNILKGAQKAYLDIPPLVKMYDKFLNFWKGTTLVSPGFHLRNLFGNMFNSYAAGMDIASQGRYLTTSVTELNDFMRIGKKLAQGADITPDERKLYNLVRGYFESGTSQTHRGIRDLEQLKTGVDAATGAGKFKTGYNNVLKFNFNVAEKMDDIQRYALYRWSLDKTGDAGKAARQVSEALFDYSHLTPFEKDIMKRIFPFYTFMKNNFIFQAKAIVNNPAAYAKVGRAYNYAIEDLAGYSPDNLPDYATENMWLPIPMTLTKNDKKAIAFLKANLPLSDFTELIENPFKKGVISVTAPVKLLIEFGAGRDLFTGAPLSQFPGQTNALEPGTGVLSGLRDRRGNLTITQSPLFQKILNDIGLRTPINMASAGLDIVDTLAGYQGPVEGVGDFLQRAGLAGVQEVENLELTDLYQDLEKLRELKKFYEQETGNQLPVLPRG
jgi:hypothetical protein